MNSSQQKERIGDKMKSVKNEYRSNDNKKFNKPKRQRNRWN